MSSRIRQRIVLALTLVVNLGVGVMIFQLIGTGYRITQMRNAFFAYPGTARDFEWTPQETPDEFLLETGTPPAEFQMTVDELSITADYGVSELDHTIAIARHFASGSGIKSDTVYTYRTILSEERGYCSDYTQAMNGLAFTAGIPIREWGMSFEAYGGYGHAFSEVYDRARGKWVFLDAFNAFYVVDRASRVPLSDYGISGATRDW